MLYMLIAISFISTITLLGLDAFRERIMQTSLKHYYRKFVDVAFVLTIACVVLTSIAGFTYKEQKPTLPVSASIGNKSF